MGHLLEGFVKGRFIIKTCCIGDFHKCPLLLFWMAEQALHLAHPIPVHIGGEGLVKVLVDGLRQVVGIAGQGFGQLRQAQFTFQIRALRFHILFQAGDK